MSQALPDVEGLVISYLAPLLGVPVKTRVPDPLPDVFLQVVRTGGPARNRILEEAQVTFTAWALAGPTPEITAIELARQARKLMMEAANRDGIALIRRVQEFAGIYGNDDPVTNCPRYTFTLALRVRAAGG